MYYIMYQKYNTPVRHLGEQRKDGCSRRRNTGELADLWRWIGGLGALSRDGSALDWRNTSISTAAAFAVRLVALMCHELQVLESRWACFLPLSAVEGCNITPCLGYQGQEKCAISKTISEGHCWAS